MENKQENQKGIQMETQIGTQMGIQMETQIENQIDNQPDIKIVDASPRAQKAMALFKEGFNCSQSVFLAFDDLYNIDRSTALKLSSSFGGGMGRLREVCGAVSGMFMVAGVLYGYDSPDAHAEKTAHYERIQELAHRFSAHTGSIVCRELLGLNIKEDSPVPERRSETYYKKRPCVQMVGLAAAIMEQYIVETE